MNYLIYKAKVKTTNEIYIGRTLTTIDNRWQQHIAAAISGNHDDTPLFPAIKKYGPENFEVKLYRTCINENAMYKQEINAIRTYNDDGRFILLNHIDEINRCYINSTYIKEYMDGVNKLTNDLTSFEVIGGKDDLSREKDASILKKQISKWDESVIFAKFGADDYDYKGTIRRIIRAKRLGIDLPAELAIYSQYYSRYVKNLGKK